MAIQKPVVITQGNTQDLRIYNLQDTVTLVFWNTASASANMYDQYGNLTEVQGVVLGYDGGGTGNYVGTVTTTFVMAIGGGYIMKIDAVQSGARFHMELPAVVIARTS